MNLTGLLENPLPSDLHDRVWHKGKYGGESGRDCHSSVVCKGCLADSAGLAGIMTTQQLFSYISVSVIFEKNKKMVTVIVSGDIPKRNMLSTLFILRRSKLSILFTEMERVACFSFPGDGHSFLVWKDILIVLIVVMV